MKNELICFLVLIILTKFSFAQTDTLPQPQIDSTLIETAIQADTVENKLFGNFWSHDPHSPKQAAIFSAIIPGLGQAYNEKYWKIPIVYAALGTAGFFIYTNSRTYNDLKNTYLLRVDGDSTTNDEYIYVLGGSQYTGYIADDLLLTYVDEWKKYTDINVIITTFIYLLNIVDAVVDAHLYNFDVSDDITLQFTPYYAPRYNLYNQPDKSFGINLKFSFK